MNFCTKDSFDARINDHPLVFDNYITHCQGENDFLFIASFYLCSFLSQSIKFG